MKLSNKKRPPTVNWEAFNFKDIHMCRPFNKAYIDDIKRVFSFSLYFKKEEKRLWACYDHRTLFLTVSTMISNLTVFFFVLLYLRMKKLEIN
ncbi:hypothetical protein B8W99_24930 [Peribacillus simplex]|nr:hypothetical protein B8W99_24930 [Peribacillus simplex]